MGCPADFRPAPGTIPTKPGVYRFRDSYGCVIYVGKAKNLRNRLNSYFVSEESIRPLSRRMLSQAASVDWTVVSNEGEALQLEWTWIQHFSPRFNIQFRDDKSYPLLAISSADIYPRVWVYRGARRKNVRYFGPYAKVGALRDTLDQLTKVFPVRTCTTGVFNRHSALGRPCLLGYIGKCCAPCVGQVDVADYQALIAQLERFLSGQDKEIVRSLTAEMDEAAASLDFEKAARLRDHIAALHAVLEKQTVVMQETLDADVIGVASDEIEASVQLFRFRHGRIVGQQGWVVSKTGESDLGEWEDNVSDPALPYVVESFLPQFYNTHPGDIPRLILVPVLPPHTEELTEQLSTIRNTRVEIRQPQRGDLVRILETVTENAAESLRQHKLKRASDLTSRSLAIEELQTYLGLPQPPLRIECTDISHIQGTNVVASLVVFEDGLPRKSDYRTYLIKEAAGDGQSNDVGSIAEVTLRRFKHYREDARAVPDSEGSVTDVSRRRSVYPPQLFVVDGGSPQAAAAAEVLKELGITDVPVVGLAKRLEEVWIPGEKDPLILPRESEALYLLQRIRDESHRTAISFHRKRRSKDMVASELEGIDGVGPALHQALMDHFGTMKKLREANADEIATVPGFGRQRAEKVFAALHA
ncbi:excinuclease ABC subunit UvrC [uncultured Lawsonella sp.]|uniref:excinuclease ABC subunit UvrC n=1 Tax=uncultured Lawsonella sp. TaxID=1847727 RepID=UPI00261B42AB|nr:excinuclease ABC subunit UvrC [uncultured Lawsonella sp.]